MGVKKKNQAALGKEQEKTCHSLQDTVPNHTTLYYMYLATLAM